MTKPFLILVAAGVVGCGGGGNGSTTSAASPDMAPGASIVGEHGQVVDYFKLTPLAGFTVSDGANTTTTDANGNWVLPAPMGTDLAPMVTGPGYSTLHLATARAAGTDVDYGAIPIPDTSSFALELSLLGADSSKALVQIIVVPTGACTSVAGGTLTVTSPSDAKVAYFATSSNLPTAAQFGNTVANRPVAVVYDIDPEKPLTVQMIHPTCKLAASGTAAKGAAYNGETTLLPAEPGDNNSVLALIAE
jgi:hypothetical protein